MAANLDDATKYLRAMHYTERLDAVFKLQSEGEHEKADLIYSFARQTMVDSGFEEELEAADVNAQTLFSASVQELNEAFHGGEEPALSPSEVTGVTESIERLSVAPEDGQGAEDP